MTINFIKMHGCGNDFLVIDNRTQNVTLSPEQIIKLGNYKTSIGFDQLLLIENSQAADVSMRIFNNDGSEVNACGNGSRCVAKLILAELNSTIVTISTKERILTATLQGELISINMGTAKIISENIDFDGFTGQLIDIGNPHIIINNSINLDVLKYGPLIENDLRFPHKVNVNFVNVISSKLIKLQVWERGAGATLSCGTGACASFYALHKQGLIDKEAVIRQAGGDLYLSLQNQEIQMAGEAKISYYGSV